MASATVGLVGLWLVSVLLFVLPTRDPDGVAIWALIAIVALGSVAAAGAFLLHPVRPVRIALGVACLLELVIGIALVAAWALTPAGATGEAYSMLVGVALALYGGVGVESSLRSR